MMKENQLFKHLEIVMKTFQKNKLRMSSLIIRNIWMELIKTSILKQLILESKLNKQKKEENLLLKKRTLLFKINLEEVMPVVLLSQVEPL